MLRYPLSPPQEPIVRLVSDGRIRGVPVIIEANAYRYHNMWSSSGTNECSECLFDFIISSNLAITNRRDEPTFLTSNRKEVLDITLVSSDFSNNLRDWFVSNECSFSDHRYITLVLI